ncbi:hypothetical protein Zmor_008020 [Zophobas morio]|uniref:Uncharacterized protein n=1 Tax=Zophobas morio TaxID=2755281 RepID=A0AA38IVC9_9CUCU|nr:hypothetical protein Zmor_008020 [Zophobas morio]
MRIAVEVVFVTGIFGGFFGDYIFALPVERHVIANGQGKSDDEMYRSYVSISNDRASNNNEVDVLSRVQQVYIDTPTTTVGKNGKQPKTTKAYLLVKTLRQRNKRYVSYLTLCHFKICNMGRKRTTRYFHMIRRQDDNES